MNQIRRVVGIVLSWYCAQVATRYATTCTDYFKLRYINYRTLLKAYLNYSRILLLINQFKIVSNSWDSTNWYVILFVHKKLTIWLYAGLLYCNIWLLTDTVRLYLDVVLIQCPTLRRQLIPWRYLDVVAWIPDRIYEILYFK